MKRTLLLISFLFILNTFLYAQEIAVGDERSSHKVKEKVSVIYETKDKTQFFMTSQNFQSSQTYGTEVIAYSLEGKYNRVVTKGFTEDGQLATEWFFDNDRLIFVFEVFEFFEEKGLKGQWENFKGIASWESRYYFNKDYLAYHKHKGRENITRQFNEKELIGLSKELLDFLSKK